MTSAKPKSVRSHHAPSPRAQAIARGIVEEYIIGLGGENRDKPLPIDWTDHEDRLVMRIAHAIERAAAGGR